MMRRQSVEAECLARVRKLVKPSARSLQREGRASKMRTMSRSSFGRRRSGSTRLALGHWSPSSTSSLIATYPDTESGSFTPTFCPGSLARQDGYRDRRGDLERASNFQSVENRVINEVVGRGKFLRMKELHRWVLPRRCLSSTIGCWSLAHRNSSGGRVLVDKRRQAISWEEEFRRGGQDEINTFITKHVGALRDEMSILCRGQLRPR